MYLYTMEVLRSSAMMGNLSAEFSWGNMRYIWILKSLGVVVGLANGGSWVGAFELLPPRAVGVPQI